MLNLMRRSANTWVIKILLVLIALSFMVWGVGDYVNRSNQLPVAEGGNWSIGMREFSLAYENEYNNLRSRFGGKMDKEMAEMFGLKQRTLTTLINRHLILAAGQDLHLAISPDMLRANIAENDAFQVGGTFDQERYRLLLRNNRLTPREFEDQSTNNMIATQIQQVVGLTVGPPDILVNDLYRLQHEKRMVYRLRLNPQDLEAEIKPSDAILTEYLEKHQDRFMTAAEVKVHYVVLDVANVKKNMTVPEEEINTYYRENMQEYQREEKRTVSHILARDKGANRSKTSDTSPKKSALERIRLAQARLDKGEDFAAVAKEMSDDVTKSKGGSLGEFSRGVMVKAFDDMAFSLPVGQVSKPVKTKYGYHLILVNAIAAGETKPLKEVSAKIKDRLLETLALDEVYKQSGVLEDQLFASGDLKAIASDLNLKYQESEFFSRAEGRKAQGIGSDTKFLDAAFTTSKGEVSTLLELKDGEFVALHVVDKKEPTPQPLAAVKKEVLALYKSDHAASKAQELMDSALTLLQEGKWWEEAGGVHQAVKSDVTELFTRKDEKGRKGRKDGKGGPSPAVRAASFRLNMEEPLYQEVIKSQKNELVIIRLKQIEPADPKGLEKAAETIRATLQQHLSQEQVASFLDGLRQAAKVKVYDEALARF